MTPSSDQLTLLDPNDPAPATTDAAVGADKDAPRRTGRRTPRQVVACGWCRRPTPVPARGRVPKWCSAACRHRAWEQRRAAASGLAAIEVVDRVVETVRIERQVKTRAVEVPVEVVVGGPPATAREFASVLDELCSRLDSGRIYDRDLPIVDEAMGRAFESLMRRLRRR